MFGSVVPIAKLAPKEDCPLARNLLPFYLYYIVTRRTRAGRWQIEETQDL